MDAVSSSTSASASSYFQDMIQKRELNQADRIAQGINSGQLTQAEADRLGQIEAKIEKLNQKAMADGTMSPTEFAQIMQAQDKASKHIFRLGHNKSTTQSSDTQSAAALASNAQISSTASSNATTTGTTIWGEMNKLFQDIAQGIVQVRQTRLDERIKAGTESGQLTAEELQKLQKMETNASETMSKAMADGTVSPVEFMQVMHAQNVASRHVSRYRHNQQFSTDASSSTAATAAAAIASAATTTYGAAVSAAPPPAYKPLSVSV
jgi:hypothetical protein